jgi:hypothetical protein
MIRIDKLSSFSVLNSLKNTGRAARQRLAMLFNSEADEHVPGILR